MKISSSLDCLLLRRPRRNRNSDSTRVLLQEVHVRVEDLILPLFVREGNGKAEEVSSMPGVFRYSVVDLVRECREVRVLGIRAVALFPVIDPKLKNERGTHALASGNILYRAIQKVKAAVPDLIVIADVALDPYTSHGHDGVLNRERTDVENDATVAVLQKLAVLEAKAGADWVAPSDMMDGRVAAIRHALDEAGFQKTGILSYSAKFASAYYGPFRDAVGSRPTEGKIYLDKKSYQLNPANAREALMEAALDEAEGADLLMVKPAGSYLDIISKIREKTTLPLAAYQVSGEYAQIHAAAKLGWLDLAEVRDESLLAIKRAGADLILTYFARSVAEDLKRKNG